MTKKYIIDDVLLQLYQGQPSDDAAVEYAQVAYWLDIHLNQLVATECNGKIARREAIPNVYIRKASCEVAEVEEDSEDNERVFVTLDDEVLSLNDNGGIVRVTTNDGTVVNRASVATMNMFNAMRFAKPSENNLLYVHEGSNIYVEGLKSSDVPFDLLNVWYVPKQDIYNAADTYEVLCSDLTLPMVIDTLVQRGKQELYGSQADQANDGVDYKAPVYHRQIQNTEQ